ncbi:MAG: FAD-dependent oxidoreductase [Gloeobacteraceae cyanobacterium ES-bin-144]|nr:FAD-dependent oxidoreductase [Verrucomicrobiales bacterium]
MPSQFTRRRFLTLTGLPLLTLGATTRILQALDLSNTAEGSVLVEAEAFSDIGGWVIDAQHMDQMGSPYLLAHGIGIPCKDAETFVKFPKSGTYRVWVRTRDWIAPHQPGKFQVIINGKALAETFGTKGAEWAWQDGGVVEVKGAAAVKVALHDLTGFDARCDVLLFVPTTAKGFIPPNKPDALGVFRRHMLGIPQVPEDGGVFDLIVAGGGFAGIGAAVAAARHGLKVALIQDRPVLGGNASSEVRVNPIHAMGDPPYPRNADVIHELKFAKPAWAYSDELKHADEQRLNVVKNEPNITLLMNTRLNGAEMKGDSIQSVVVQDILTGKRLTLKATYFADCTGDSVLGALVKADYRIGRESRAETDESFAPEKPDQLLLGNSQYWYASDEGVPSAFTPCPGALEIKDDSMFEVSKPKYPQKESPGVTYSAGWNWETGFAEDNIANGEMIRDHAFRAVYGTWNYLKNLSAGKAFYATSKIKWLAHVVGKRENRRMIGDFILKQQHIEENKIEDDGCVTATWYFDIHFPHPDNSTHFPGKEFRSLAYDDPQWDKLGKPRFPGRYLTIKPYPIPYRCLYSKNIPNLFMAGRNISVTHVALAPVRTMLCTGMMGVVVGRAAALCKRKNGLPRDVYAKHLAEFKAMLTKPEDFGYKTTKS